jgi:hypothetical protein
MVAEPALPEDDAALDELGFEEFALFDDCP